MGIWKYVFRITIECLFLDGKFKRKMPIITLTTDMGLKDYYVGAVKGAILTQFPGAVIVDISHSVSSFDIQEAAFIIKNCYLDFPPGTIHIIGVNPERSEDTPHIACFINGHYFIGADNGIFSIVFDKKPVQIVELKHSGTKESLTFPTRDVFVAAACHLAQGGALEKTGSNTREIS